MNAADLKYAQDFAATVGVKTQNPALLAMYDAIRKDGMRTAREAHDERYKLVKRYADNPGLLYVRLRPSLGLSDAIDDANRYVFNFRNLPRWRQDSRQKDYAKHIENRLLARFFRRFGKRIWMRSAA
jgi:hypothetical protein